MDLSELRHGVQARHPWETARAAAIVRILRAAGISPRHVLDFGCGDGYSGEHVCEAFAATECWGVDVNLSDSQCRERKRGRFTYTNDAGVLGARQFDMGLLCDVIEHVEDDRGLLAELSNRLVPGGKLLITVPAFQALFTRHDVALRHYRRYSLAQLELAVTDGGYRLQRSGYLFGSLLPARALGKLLELMKPKPSDAEPFGIGGWTGSAATTRVLEAVLNADNALLLELSARGVKLPGLSAWALCEKS